MTRYFFCLVPYAPPEHATEWHCQDTQGNWAHATLTRGSFPSPHDCILWAQTFLNGTPYTIRCHEYDPEEQGDNDPPDVYRDIQPDDWTIPATIRAYEWIDGIVHTYYYPPTTP